ncbi:MAG TPA: HNH endonuclease [Methanoregula sp.]|nr:HNH endonuclease [Methanoregula sp.]
MYEIEEILNSGKDSAGIPDESEDLSWIIEPGVAAVKKTDRAVFLFREMTIPQPVRAFFSVENLTPGEKQKIVFWHANRRFDAFIEKTIHDPPLIRMMWRPDFGAVLNKEFPQWLEFFKKNRGESEETPCLQFSARPEPGHYEVELEGVHSREASADAELPFAAGDVIRNETLTAAFRCSPQGAIRRSLAANCLVLISDHTRSVYEDKWIGRHFHYTGMGLSGEQSLSLQQNRALADSKENGTVLHLFEVFLEGDYVYIGEVELSDSPYRSRQPDSEQNLRDVFIFPLQLKGGKHPLHATKALPATEAAVAPKPLRRMPMDELEFQARYSLKDNQKHTVVSEVYQADELVSEYARRRAGGTCQLCNRPAPFATPDGEPFLEVHHIIPLADGGPDTIENTVALCPNCHKKMHVLNLPADVVTLMKRSVP